ncbi:hypothetical protein PI126_g1582 [Phytophthora idaei]|nr:hypothetical protein PI126_g1582 [Phytophthora idaei]
MRITGGVRSGHVSEGIHSAVQSLSSVIMAACEEAVFAKAVDSNVARVFSIVCSIHVDEGARSIERGIQGRHARR